MIRQHNRCQRRRFAKNIDLFTYSFPCQDLSVCGSWHGNMSGIDRNANNRSGMLWEVERILKEYVEKEITLPKFLLMENVSNILSATHKDNFKDWRNYLKSIGYKNQIYNLNAADFEFRRKESAHICLACCEDEEIRAKVKEYFKENDLNSHPKVPIKELDSYLRTDYSIPKYRTEADNSNPNFTPSRKRHT